MSESSVPSQRTKPEDESAADILRSAFDQQGVPKEDIEISETPEEEAAELD